MLIVKLTKIVNYVDGAEVKPVSLNMEDIGELFDVIKVKAEDCAGLALTTNRYDTKEINLKKDVDPTSYLLSPFEFKDTKLSSPRKE